MPGLVVTLRGDMTQYEAIMARSVAVAKASAIAVQKEYEKAQLVVSGRALSPLNPLMFGRSGASTIVNKNEIKSAAEDYGAWWSAALIAQEGKITAAEIEVASRSNRARQLWRQRAIQRSEAAAVDLAMLTTIATGGGASANNPSGGHGGGGLTGIIRESLVIMREVSMGRGLGRIGGSVTLLAQYLGILGLAVKSTATESLLASKTATVLSQKLAAQALAAKGTAAYTQLLAASQAQEAVAAQTATDANIALKGATVTLNPLFFGIVGAIVAVGAAAFFLWRHFSEARIEAKNLKEALNPLRKSFTDLADAEKKSAEAAQENKDWINDLLKTHKSESNAIERKIKLLKEEAAARGLSNKQTLQMERDLLLTEQKRLQIELDNAVASEKSASDADRAGATTTDFSTGDVINFKNAQDKLKTIGDIANAAQAAMENKKITEFTGPSVNTTFGSVRSAITRNANENDVLDFKVGSKSFSMTLADAKNNFQRASDQAKKLETDQKALDDVLKDSKATAKEKADALAKVQDDLTDINDELAHPVKERGRMEVTERERIGAAGNSVSISQLDVSKKHLAVAQKTFDLIAGRQGDPDVVGGAGFA